MLPSQILLNNLLYDTSQLAIPTDQVDPEQVRRPTHWDLRFIRRFMLVFGPLSSVFDFLTFALMLTVFHTDQHQFRTGWFVESLATQTLIIFVIRTRRIPFIRSQPSLALTLAALGVVLVGVLLPMTPLATTLGFQALPAGFLLALVGLIVTYLVLVECGKALFYRLAPPYPAPPAVTTGQRHLRRRAHQFSH
jgi:Mg2+-importing ATPase